MSHTRRSLLRRAGATAAITAGVAIALPDPAPSQRPERPTDPHDGELPEVTSEAEGLYALWQYSRERHGYEPTSPINLIVTLAGTDRTLDDVMEVFRAAGWVERPIEYVRYAYDARTGEYDRQHATAAQTVHGGFGRHHIRAWGFGGYVSIQAHEDTAAMPKHEIVSYESTRHLVEWLFHDRGWTVKPDGAVFDNANPPDHTGYVTVIEP